MAEEVKTIDYEVTAEQRKNLTPQEIAGFIKSFNNYDKNKDGHMDESEFKSIMIDMGHRKTSDADAAAMIKENDQNADGVIAWNEFVDMMVKMKGSNPDAFAAVQENEHGGKHTIDSAQVATFAKLINVILNGDEDLKDYLPIACDGESLFHSFDNGVLLAKIVAAIDPDAIDLRVIKNVPNMSVFQINNNLKLGLAASKSLGVKLIGVAPDSFVKKVPHLMLTAIWQLLRKVIAMKMNLADCAELFRLLEEGEDPSALSKLKPEEILIRWVNYHLRKNGQDDKQIKNLAGDLKDSHALTHVLNRLDNKKCSLDSLSGDDHSKAQAVIDNACAIGVPDLISAEDITKGDEKVLTLFVAYMFNTKHGLEELTEDEYKLCAMVDDDVEGSREERAFRLWVNSLNIPGIYIDDLYDGVSDGWTLCKVVDKVQPGVVEWKNVAEVPKNYQFGNPSNIGEAIKACKKPEMGLKMIGIGQSEIHKKDKKEILATAWSVCKTHYKKVIGGKTDKDLVAWANERVGDAAPHITKLDDKTNLCSGVFWIKLIATIEARGIDEELVTAGETEEDQKMNAKYAISLARSIGAVVFMVWEDMVAANSKQCLIFASTLYDLSLTYGNNKDE